MDIKEQKKELRKYIAATKKSYSMEWKMSASHNIMSQVESMPSFQQANTILLYYSLNDEVQTEFFLKKWYKQKRLVLPLVQGEDLILKPYNPNNIIEGYCSINEPTGDEIVYPEDIEFAIVPGVAFDGQYNRLGRGRGFYDRLLPYIECDIVGLGYDFQIVDRIPMEPFDKPLTKVLYNIE